MSTRSVLETVQCAEAEYGMGVALRKIGKHEDAIEHFQNSLAIEPDERGAVWDNFGTSLIKLCKFELAVMAYKNACEIDPSNKNYERGKKQAETLWDSLLSTEATLAKELGLKLEAEALMVMTKQAVAGRAEAEQQANNARKRAYVAEQLAKDAEIRAQEIEKSLATKTQRAGESIKDYELVYRVGEGASAQVWAAVKKQKSNGGVFKASSSDLVAIKVIDKTTDALEPWRIVEEKEIMETLSSHPYIVSLHAAFQSESSLYFVLDYCEGGDFFGYLEDRLSGKHGTSQGLNVGESASVIYFAEIALALDHLHTNGIAYRDLKPENILMTRDGHLCLTDFGLSRKGVAPWKQTGVKLPAVKGASSTSDKNAKEAPRRARLMSFVGTPEYLAPEVLTKKGHGMEVDWWALGVLLHEMVFGLGCLPFDADEGDTVELFRKIITAEPEIGRGGSKELCDIMKGLLQKDPSKRSIFKDLKRHPWIARLDWSDLLRKAIPAPFQVKVSKDTLSSLRKKAKKKKDDKKQAVEDEQAATWEKFTSFTKHSNMDNASLSLHRNDTGPSLQERAESLLVPFMSPDISLEEAEKIAQNAISPAATLILQGEIYSGPKGYVEYRKKLHDRVQVHDIQIINTRSVLEQHEIHVNWHYRAVVDSKTHWVRGCTQWRLDSSGMMMSGMNSIGLINNNGEAPPSASTEKNNKALSSMKVHGKIEQKLECTDAEIISLALDFAEVESMMDISDIEEKFRRLVSPNVVLHTPDSWHTDNEEEALGRIPNLTSTRILF